MVEFAYGIGGQDWLPGGIPSVNSYYFLLLSSTHSVKRLIGAQKLGSEVN
jgi:hypothetical protein